MHSNGDSFIDDAEMLAAIGAWITQERLACGATSYTVCLSGCPFTTVQNAINAAGRGETITVGPGVATLTAHGTRPAISIASNATARIKGFTIKQGRGRGAHLSQREGGAMELNGILV